MNQTSSLVTLHNELFDSGISLDEFWDKFEDFEIYLDSHVSTQKITFVDVNEVVAFSNVALCYLLFNCSDDERGSHAYFSFIYKTAEHEDNLDFLLQCCKIVMTTKCPKNIKRDWERCFQTLIDGYNDFFDCHHTDYAANRKEFFVAFVGYSLSQFSSYLDRVSLHSDFTQRMISEWSEMQDESRKILWMEIYNKRSQENQYFNILRGIQKL